MSVYDYIVVGFYFAFMLLIGWSYRRHYRNTSDYFRGGGAMTWWMVGASSWVQGFSAWTFVGLAGAAYSRGALLAWVSISGCIGILSCILWTAARYRRLRVITWVEALRDRYGVPTEQFYAYANLLQGFIYGGSGLYILAVFMTAIFGLDLKVTVITIGVVMTVVSVCGGAWAVAASDFVQSLLILAVIIVTAVLTLNLPEVGGLSGFFARVPASHWHWGFDVRWEVLALWIGIFAMNSVLNMNNLSGVAAKLIMVKDEKSAVKALYIPLIGALILPVFALIPALAATFLFPDIDKLYPQLNFPKEAAYAAVAGKALPTGMLGMLACAMFAASMTTMDAALNRNAGIFVRNIYLRVIRPRSSEKEALLVGKLFTVLLGGILVWIGLMFARYKDLPIFELGALIGSLVAQPLLIPLMLAIFIRRVPQWAAISTAAVGFLTAWLVMGYVPLETYAGLVLHHLNVQETFDLKWMLPNLVVTVVCFGWFFLTMLFYREPAAGSAAAVRVDEFFRKQETPINLKAEGIAECDNEQARMIGRLCLIYGSFVSLGLVIPNSWGGRLVFPLTGFLIAGAGLILLRAGRRQPVTTPTAVRENAVADGLNPAAERS